MEESFLSKSKAKKVQSLVQKALQGTDFSSHAPSLARKIDGRWDLDTRVRELGNTLGIIDSVFGGTANFDRWLTATKKSRNSLAHTGADIDSELLTLRAIVVGAQAMVELAIFKALGFDAKRIGDIAVKRHLNVKWWTENYVPRVDGTDQPGD
jgi:hypothetical protein